VLAVRALDRLAVGDARILLDRLQAAGGSVFRVVYCALGCPAPCNRTVQEAPAGSNNWQTDWTARTFVIV